MITIQQQIDLPDWGLKMQVEETKVWTRVFKWRFAFGLLGASLTSLGVSYSIAFYVADYVVKANTASNAAAFGAMQNSLDLLNQSGLTTNQELSGMRGEIGTLLQETSSQTTEIAFLRRDIERIQEGVQSAGINIPVVSQTTGGWSVNTDALQELVGEAATGGNQPIFLQFNPSLDRN